ncbi:NADP-dependent oxidoreductase [Homoserinibacter sp. YIM 151385]|uniref:NADP-dependent oxidoreductase n=1 Tax=Homoserinibacter sp. YIM 151385 TaxID=2985506 RepID=UPI0022F0E586|nr:NADP-dependent oxidoreductase [Homoserinibacter sp. YIM 151385]WBU37491.1 NADP-dependent oxidoreductase [Homoserinibacter sp. YIM 151385]
MQAIRFHQVGDADVLRLEDVARPEPAAGQVRIRVAGAAFNPADAGIRAGRLPIPVTLPHIPSYDVSGTVDALGEGVDSLAVGDAVIGFLPMTEDGAAAEYAIAPAETLTAAPTGLPLADAAGLPSVALTARQALFDEAGLVSGQRVLIMGAGGPVGGYAVQLAARAGAHVIATASPRSRASIEASGAHQIIDHADASPLEAVDEPVNVLLNLAPLDPAELEGLVALVRDGGVLVSTTAWMPAPGDEARGVRGVVVYVRSDRAQLAELVALVDAGELRVEIAERVPLAELPAVHARAAVGAVHGKVIALPAGA